MRTIPDDEQHCSFAVAKEYVAKPRGPDYVMRFHAAMRKL
jgi:hypothetical protein